MQHIANHEFHRLLELDRYGILGTPPEDGYDLLCQLAADVFSAPVAFINLVAEETVWVKARFGFEAQEIPRRDAFCDRTVQGRELLVIQDLSADERFRHNPIVACEDGFRFYAGAPLVTPNGYSIGTICILDKQTRPMLTPRECERLANLACLVMDRMEKQRLERLEVMTSSLMDAAAEAVVIADARHCIRYWNRAAETILGLDAAAMIGKPVASIAGNEHDARSLHDALCSKSRTDNDRSPLSFSLHRDRGRPLEVEISVASWDPRSGQDGSSGFGLIIRDVTEQQAAVRKIGWMTRHDELTGVMNRNHLRMRMSEALAAGKTIAIISTNLDRFMAINETFGHRVGDALLKSVALRLQQETDPGDILARTGGDEFTIMRISADEKPQLIELASRLQNVFSDAFAVEGHLITATASIGIVASPDVGETNTDALLNAADLAIYRAKADGGHGWRVFTPEDNRISAIRSMEIDLHGALARREFSLQYQPQFDLASGRLVGAEALLRWTHPVRGSVSPADFIPVAEFSGQIVPISTWVMDMACDALTRLPEHLRISINLSPVQFRRSDVAATLGDALSTFRVDPRRLEVEITESLLLENSRDTAKALADLKMLGIGIALDDFGTGYSSLSYLSKFPFDVIKIDRSFVQTLEKDCGSAAIVKAVIGLGRDFRMKVIAEGVETEEQRAMLQSLGCDEGQGYFLGRPMGLDALLKLAG